MACLVNVLFNVDTKLNKLSVPSEIKKGQRVVVKLENGNDIALVVSNPFDGELEQQKGLSFVRIASEKDLEEEKKKQKENDALREKVWEIIKKYNLNLKIIRVHLSFDGSKLLIVYTAPERVDFRELVKQLAGTFKTHIEMRQVNERESACIVGGFAECGQELCCRRFLRSPKVSTIKMAKVQDVALNPNKVNGVCGKLRCCLYFEYNDYKLASEKMPPLNTEVLTPKGKGVVVGHNLLNETVLIKFENEEDAQNYALNEIKTA